MTRSVDSFKNELQKIRTGRPPGILDQFMSYYCSMGRAARCQRDLIAPHDRRPALGTGFGPRSRSDSCVRPRLTPPLQGDLLRGRCRRSPRASPDLTKVVRRRRRSKCRPPRRDATTSPRAAQTRNREDEERGRSTGAETDGSRLAETTAISGKDGRDPALSPFVPQPP